MTRKTGLIVLALGLTACAGTKGSLASDGVPDRQPNVLVIVADDMGYSDAGCYGGEVRTPTLDKLAAGGVRFTNFYNTARCWTTRVSVLTGLYHHYAESIHLGKRKNAATRLLPELLGPLGYRCYQSGKWHVRGADPMKRGFDHAKVIRDHDRFFSPKLWMRDGEKLAPQKHDSDYYLTTDIAQHAIDCLAEHAEKHADKPFFSYLAFTCPHFPLQAKPEDIAHYRDVFSVGWDAIRKQRLARMKKMGLVDCDLSPRDPKTVAYWSLSEKELKAIYGPGEVRYAVAWDGLTDEQKQFQATKMAIHAAMVHRMDIEIGRVIEQLRKMGQLDNTIVMFLSDNGASAEMIDRGDKHDRSAPLGSAGSYLCLGPGFSTAANTPFYLHKSWVHEGGIATPFIVHWPAGLKARGELRRGVGHVVDIVPTICRITGAQYPQTINGKPVAQPHGKSILSAILRDQPIERDFLFWEHIGNRAWREGDWKLVRKRDADQWELYNLAADPSEIHDLAASQPQRVQAMAERWEAYFRKISIPENKKKR